ncbi:MAG: TrmH family RNA methyltransferase [bacterium]|nr:TrmH family RNA methyltransferase [bacterium]
MISQTHEICLALHNIRSTHNVGAIFRTADAIGVSKIYISGYTPAPADRFGRMRKDIAKSALGAEKMVEWEAVEDLTGLIAGLKKEKFTVFAVEQDKRSVDYKKTKPPQKSLLILGNEIEGIERGILDKCDKILEISMKGKKESLNVSVAAGIVLFGIFG